MKNSSFLHLALLLLNMIVFCQTTNYYDASDVQGIINHKLQEQNDQQLIKQLSENNYSDTSYDNYFGSLEETYNSLEAIRLEKERQKLEYATPTPVPTIDVVQKLSEITSQNISTPIVSSSANNESFLSQTLDKVVDKRPGFVEYNNPTSNLPKGKTQVMEDFLERNGINTSSLPTYKQPIQNTKINSETSEWILLSIIGVAIVLIIFIFSITLTKTPKTIESFTPPKNTSNDVLTREKVLKNHMDSLFNGMIKDFKKLNANYRDFEKILQNYTNDSLENDTEKFSEMYNLSKINVRKIITNSINSALLKY